MSQREIRAFEMPILTVAKDILASPRWDQPNTPGGDYITELSEHIGNGEYYAAFRETVAGRFYLSMIEPLEAAITSEWLPYECIGLPLPDARAFLQRLVAEVEQHGLENALPVLCTHHTLLKAGKQ